MENVEFVNVPKDYAILMVNIIAVCSKRGAFSPEEFRPIGTVFEFLKKELKIEDQQTQQTQQTQ